MLISILANLVQIGGVIPPTPTPHPSDDVMEMEGGGGVSAELLKKRLEARKKILDQDEEDWILFIHNFIVSNNLN